MGQKPSILRKRAPPRPDTGATADARKPGVGADATGAACDASPSRSAGMQRDATRVAARVSLAAIDDIVDEFMADSAINSAMLPDFIERAVYRNVLQLLLGVAGRVIDTAEVGFLGHNVTMKLSPDTVPPTPRAATEAPARRQAPA